jgi:[ribosomal protein S5]-alanine N-acetyltransferase
MEKVLETERLILRKFTEKDLPQLHEILSNPETMKFWPAPFTLEQTQRWLNRSITANKLTRYAVILKENGELIGDFGFMRTEVNGVEENDLGYIFSKEYWGKGLATEAASTCLKYGKEILQLERIVASMENKNIASKRVAEKIGMKLEREFINARNRNLPTLLFSI